MPLLLALTLAACGKGTGANTTDGGDGGGVCTNAGLFLVSPQAVTLSAQATAELKVRYACDSVPYPGQLVSFEIVGDPKGSTLASAAVQTDAEGVAVGTLTAGTQAASFQVKASVPGATPLTFSITVNTENVGTIVVTMHYGGTNVFTEYKAYLFQNKLCTTLDPFAISGALQEAAPVAALSAKPQFVSVPVGSNYTVAVVAKKNTEILGFGCTQPVAVVAAAKTDVDVTINDIPITFNGTYLLDNKFDFAGLLPPTVGNIVHIFDEMTDDHELQGSAAKDEWGIDPAAFLLDLVYRQICHWECGNPNPDFDNCTNPGFHPYGDLKLIYVKDFKSWDGAQPIAWGMCGILDESWGVNQWMQQQVQDFIESNVPGIVLRILDMIGDLARAIDKAHITSRLILNDIRPGRQGNFQHDLLTMLVDLHDLQGTLHQYTVDLAQAGVGTLSYSGNTTVVNDKLQIPEHTFQIKFGKLVKYIYLHGLLPLLGYSSTAQMLQDWVNCTAVGNWLYQEIVNAYGSSPLSATQIAGYCQTGLTLGGNYIDSSMDTWINETTQFTLQGVAAAGAIDSHRIATQLDGVPPTSEEGWVGHWQEGSQSGTFTGTFTGTRQ